MRFRCIVSYRSTRSKSVSTWRTNVQAEDITVATTRLVEKLKRRQRRPITVVGMYMHEL
jgi:CO dehydrogenase/acetyl-CoA synthase epsilon subunit